MGSKKLLRSLPCSSARVRFAGALASCLRAGSHVLRAQIRWALVRDPSGERDPQAFLCTDLDLDPTAILRRFVCRWRIETTFQEVREHLGIKTQRQ